MGRSSTRSTCLPRQANKNMVLTLAEAAGTPGDQIFFNIERVGKTSSASILRAVHHAVREGRIDRPMRVFAPSFCAGAVGGYVVMRVDPAICEAPILKQESQNDERCRWKWKRPTKSLAGKVALVTGASRGMPHRTRTCLPWSERGGELPGGRQTGRNRCR